LIYRQALRRTEKAKYRNNLRGHWLAWLTTLSAKARLRAALRSREHLKVLEYGEQVLQRNPWDVPTQMRMAEAADLLGLLDLAVWNLEQARQKAPRDPTLNRALAAMYERRGNFSQAAAIWEVVRRESPTDAEAQQKVKDLAASETIARGGYEGAIENAAARTGRVGTGSSARHKPISTAVDPAVTPTLDRVAREAAPLQARVKTDPTNAMNYLQLASFYRRHERLDEARNVLTEGLGATGNAFELTTELADLDIQPFRRDLAVAAEKLKASPGDVELQRVHERLSKEIANRELELYRQKADRFPTELGYKLEMGIRLYQLGQTDEAIKELQAVRGDPRNQWRALYHLGHCFLARLNSRLALRNFEEALQALPTAEVETRKELLYLLATGTADAGDYERALDLAAELAHLDYGYRDIGVLMEEWGEKKR
jgi:tetratricopeptide (TPR) repeat protein